MKRSYKIILTLAACLSTVTLAIINSSHGSMLLPFTEHYLGHGGAGQGYPSSAMQIGSITGVVLLVFFGGRLTLRGKVLTLSAASLIMASAMVLLGLSPASFAVFVALFAVVGVAYGTTDVLSSALIADAYGDKSSGMMCILHGCHGSAGIIAPIAVSAILASGGAWSAPYLYIGGFIFIVCVYIFASYLAGKRKSGENTSDGGDRAGVLPLMVKKSLLSAELPMMFYGVYLTGMICYTENYEKTVRPEDARLLTLSLLYLGLTGCRLILPLIRIEKDVYLRWSAAIASALLFAGILSQSGIVYVILSAISALIAGAYIPVAISAACERLPGRTTAASTVMNLYMLIGNMVASPLIGALGAALGAGVGLCIPASALALAFACTFIKE